MEVSTMKSWQKMLCVGAVTVLAVAAKAETTPITLPEVGVDIGAYAQSGLTYLGTFLGTIIGGTIAIIGIRAGVRWISSMMRGR